MSDATPGPCFGSVIFDLDGTLADTLDDLVTSVNHALAQAEVPCRTRDEVRRFVGNGARQLFVRALGPAYQDRLEAGLAEFRHHYAAHQLDRTRPYAGVRELLAELRARQIVVSVLSNKPDAATRALVGSLFPDVPFRVVAGERPGIALKPDPAAALAVAREVGIAPDRTVFVGDSSMDMETARRAGMCAAGAAWGFRSREELLDAGALVILDEPADLVRVLDRGPMR